jgi:hypothetical protein
VAILVDFMVIWYIIPRFGMLYQEKTGNPVGSKELHLTRKEKKSFT